MKKNKNNMFRICFVLFFLFGLASNNLLIAQKIDVDNLLKEVINDVNKSKNYDSSLEKSQLGISLAPDYLDFYLLTGRIYQLTQKNDSARYYFNYVIDKNVAYEDAFSYLITLDLGEKKYADAEITVDKAIAAHPENKGFNLKKMVVYQLEKDEKKEYQYLQTLNEKYPEDNEIKQRLFLLELKINSDRIGVNYSFTTFDRDGYGPWHLGSAQYIRERSWGSLIGRVGYANRFALGQSVVNGIQYEVESYFFTGKNSYSYVGAAFSEDLVFPKLRLGYSYFQNFKKGWEADLGLRYIKTTDSQFSTAVIGIGKYIDSYWINFRTFIQKDKNNFFPAFTLTSRYYFNTKFDYITLIAGYGTSPDERTTLGQIDQRIALDSYRISGGYYRLVGNHFITGIQLGYNNQEYFPNLMQNELELSLMLQYKF